MAYDMVFSGAPDQEGAVERFYLCSIGSWTQFGKWANSIEGESAAKSLFANGEFTGTDQLSAELSAATPSDPGVRATIAAILDKLGVGHPEETMSIVDEDDDDGDDNGDDDSDGDSGDGGGDDGGGDSDSDKKLRSAAGLIESDQVNTLAEAREALKGIYP